MNHNQINLNFIGTKDSILVLKYNGRIFIKLSLKIRDEQGAKRSRTPCPFRSRLASTANIPINNKKQDQVKYVWTHMIASKNEWLQMN